MFQFEDVQFQLVELPALVPRNDEEFQFQEGSSDLVRSSDGDLSADPARQLDIILAELARSQVSPRKLESNANIVVTRSGGVRLLAAGRLLGCT